MNKIIQYKEKKQREHIKRLRGDLLARAFNYSVEREQLRVNQKRAPRLVWILTKKKKKNNNGKVKNKRRAVGGRPKLYDNAREKQLAYRARFSDWTRMSLQRQNKYNKKLYYDVPVIQNTVTGGVSSSE